ncbi:putative AlkP superfamily pyrophosphatase or phosphodiesterase [Dyadobacter jejuensis]|uniref:Putative AlkP superfamily pyrophosphatase or phosphodiesterase n=1 Tax=Dyadobacter jejuensis TaxID=1082580 RepID=A0A316B644_9BACT|nr:ectonucleotide pyrophosphatase/phosphodiesterase [Dyadobacter jejuensis]PWJ58067.1 putative AlkP superfamily pyrophosphatase or phosphodiesterase [Dyadobacter jejuensis]
MRFRNIIFGLVLMISLAVLSACQSGKNLNHTTSTVNSKASLKKPYLILISLDGFRWDYVNQYKPPFLSSFIQNGVQAESLIPAFPSKTFPNHYTIATGLYPEGHGIIGNTFFNYKKDVTYKIGNRDMVEDGSFYGGTPIWVQADKAQMVTASYFFVGSEANIQGVKPTYYYKYDGNVKNEDRVAQALKWLTLPAKTRPHLITLYFSDMDDFGHRYGPDNQEKIKTALFQLDKNLGELFKGVAASGLPVNVMVVSDHGMTPVETTHLIPTESIKNDSLYTVMDNGAIMNIHPQEGVSIDGVLSYLQQKESHFKVYKTEDTPGFEYTPKSKDWGALQIIPDKGYYFSSRQGIDSKVRNGIEVFGVHGYDPTFKDMQGIFYAQGPAFKKGYTTGSVKNIHLYPLMCKILGLPIPAAIDGQLNELEGVLAPAGGGR